MEFPDLEKLRRFLEAEIRPYQVVSLGNYHDAISNGFHHKHDDPRTNHFSTASTATCIASLVATGAWRAPTSSGKAAAPEPKWGERSEQLAIALLKGPWSSAKLPEDNPFTTAFVLEAVTLLESVAPSPLQIDPVRVRHAEDILLKAVEHGKASIQEYPPSAYLTQLAVRVLRSRGKLDDAPGSQIVRKVLEWAWREIDHQIALSIAGSKSADVFQLAYSIILAAALSAPDEATPDQSLILAAALHHLFEQQLPDGSWPRSQPLFHYPGVGSAYCFEYEMLVQLLQQGQLRDKLLRYLPNLSNAAYSLRDTAFRLRPGGVAWTSGHHPQLPGPESWSTASVYHFAHVLDRLVAEAIRRAVFEYLDTPYAPPQAPSTAPVFASDFLDCEIQLEGKAQSLRETILHRFVMPIAASAKRVSEGRALPEDTAMSAILFGPPGTSKTELTKKIAEYLHWPRLTVDPSHFVRRGMDNVQAEADRLFGMFAVAESIVVLLDEFDEMVKDRNLATEILSRFLTTAMLPKLATINKNRRLAFIVATNHIEHFDLAISRHGRFDVIAQVMCPTLDEKLKEWPKVAEALAKWKIKPEKDVAKHISALTFLEFKTLAPRLAVASSAADLLQLLTEAHESCTLNTKADPREDKKPVKWSEVCHEQESKIRFPAAK